MRRMAGSSKSMSRRYSSHQILLALRHTGFEQISQRGSHIKLRARRGIQIKTVIVKHPDPAGTFASILRQAGLTREEFERLL
jgi:predicted RNA binding protein YcfA (HicA-like mRNA interferase family)